ncbi:MAG TPA: hypothetical protein VLL97_01840 [Acidobacteriota bacterium]|nr:hypothetical protein [Acidobacteriota bacterium]
MKNINSAFMILLLATVVAVPFHQAPAQDNSSTNPAGIGDRVRSMVELGSVYSNIYDIAVTVLEIARGSEAMNRLRAENAKSPAPAEGSEYILARIRFELNGRALNHKLTFELGDAPLQWVALSEQLIEYPQVAVAAPAPRLAGTVHPGRSVEGWVAFAVNRKDTKPVMVFDPDTGGATGRGRTLFFKLY